MRLRGVAVCSVAGILAGCALESGHGEDDSDSASAISSADPAYPDGALHSTLTPAIVASLQGVLAGGSGDTHRFVKVGDSITLSTSFLDCLSSTSEASDLETTRQYFDEATGRGSETSWNRATESAIVGWHTLQPITGSPSPLDTEVAAMNPAFAVVMLGTNDNDPSQVSAACASGAQPCAYRANLEKVVDTLLGKHIIPLLSTIPPRGNSAAADARVPVMNSVVRLVAAERKIPLMDFHLALTGLPGKGLGPDGIHPSAGANACDFSASGLSHGYNVRNQLALEALDQVRQALLAGDAPVAPADTTPSAPTTTSGPIPDSTLTNVDDYDVVASALNCRSGAGTDDAVVDLLSNGAALTAIADSDEAPRVLSDDAGASWLHVTSPTGATCYVEADSSLISPQF